MLIAKFSEDNEKHLLLVNILIIITKKLIRNNSGTTKHAEYFIVK